MSKPDVEVKVSFTPEQLKAYTAWARREVLQEAIEAIIASMRPEEGWSEFNSHMLAAAERVRELDPNIPYPVKPVPPEERA